MRSRPAVLNRPPEDRATPARRSINDFALVKEIGSGAVSSVYYAFCRKSTLRVAIKVYNKTKLTKLNQRQVRDTSTQMPHAGWRVLDGA
eukprot:357008-Chlamydomonas_euryale.AAC.7